jgi:hypothetical protein
MSFITFDTIGLSGNLGSQIQQYSSLFAIAKETNKRIVFSKSSLNLGFGLKFSKALNIDIELVHDSVIKNTISLHPEDVIFDQSVFNLDPNMNYNVTNLLHSYQYWYPKYKDEIINLGWNNELLEQANKIKQDLLPKDKELVSLHVRRGDYLFPEHHHFCQLDNSYYEEALNDYITEIEKYHFVIFSNDIAWCKNNLIEGDMVTFIDPNSDYIDMILMSLCDHNIIANSSFSWWPAFMNKNPNKKITSPTNYIKNYSKFNFLNNNYQIPGWKKILNQA